MPRYETEGFQPPAAVVRAGVRGPGGLVLPNVPLLIDTGADVSVIPLGVAEAVGATIELSRVLVRFYSGTGETLNQAELSVEFARYRFEGQFLVAESEYGILGRNILNALSLTLDGPQLRWSFSA